MPIPTFDYQPLPFAAPRHTSNTSRLQNIYGDTGAQLARISLERGRSQSDALARVAAIISTGAGTVREGKARKEAQAIRATEREQERLEREAERKAREAERAADKAERATEVERGAARYAVDKATPGPQSAALLALAQKFPETAARFRVQAPLAATVTPGAMGEVATGGEGYPVLEPTAEQADQAGLRQLQRERFAAEDARALKSDARAGVDDARQAAALSQQIDYQNKSLGIQQTAADTARMNAETTRQRYTGQGVDTTKLGPLANVLDRAILTITPNKRGAILSLAHRYADEGNTQALKEVVQQAAIENEDVETKKQIRARMSTVAALKDAQIVLGEMKKAGVPTNWLSGTAEDLARKLGTSTDPRYVAFATQLQDTLINYRRAATGAAFGEREGADYAKMFPNYRQTLPVNEATINGLTRSMETTDREYWRGKLGEDGVKAIFGDGGAAPADDGVERWERGPDGKLRKAGG